MFRFTLIFFFSSRRRHTRSLCDWSSDVCSSDLAPETPHIFRMRYGVTKQWRSPHARNLREGWNRAIGPEEGWVLWGDPLLKLGNGGRAMCQFPNDARLKRYASAPAGTVNDNEDFWVMM